MLKLKLDITQADIDAALAHRSGNWVGEPFQAGAHCPAARALNRALADRRVPFKHAGCGFSVACVTPADGRDNVDSEASEDLRHFTHQFDFSRPVEGRVPEPVPAPAVIDLVFPDLADPELGPGVEG